MSQRILLDSCIWGGAKKTLEDFGYDVKWVGDFMEDPGDEVIIKFAYQEARILITLDKDFGELAVFKGLPHKGIIRIVDFSGEVSANILRQYSSELKRKAIITVERARVRVRMSE